MSRVPFSQPRALAANGRLQCSYRKYIKTDHAEVLGRKIIC